LRGFGRPTPEFAHDHGDAAGCDEDWPFDYGDQADRCCGDHGAGTDVALLDTSTDVFCRYHNAVGDGCPDLARSMSVTGLS
jgi:hypothetical protein